MTDNIYRKISKERKEQQANGNVPEWVSTGGYQMFNQKYLYEADSWREQVQRIADTAASHLPDPELWSPRFFDLMWKGWLSPATPVLANMGTDRGLPVSCLTGDSWINVEDVGLKRMVDIEVGDRVLTHKGRYRKVIYKQHRESEDDLYMLKVDTRQTPIKITGNHQVLTNLGWVRVDELDEKIHWIATNKNIEHIEKESKIEPYEFFKESEVSNKGHFSKTELPDSVLIDEDLAWALGLWFAEGSLNRCKTSLGTNNEMGRSVRITMNKLTEKDFLMKWGEILSDKFGVNYTFNESNHGNWSTCTVNSVVLANYFGNKFGLNCKEKTIPVEFMSLPKNILYKFLEGFKFGLNCKEKTIPVEFMSLPKNILYKFLEGFYCGDGRKSGGNRIFTPDIRIANPQLCAQLYEIALKVGLDVSLSLQNKGKMGESSQLSFFDGGFEKRERTRAYRFVDFTDGNRYCRFSLSKIDANETVYDITVEEDESFSVSGVIVHNCSGCYVEDSVQGFYESATEIALLSKWGFGTSAYLGDIRPRGSAISRGGKSSGVVPVIKNLTSVCRDISQGCYDDKTEVLTDQGWLYFEDVISDTSIKVAQVHDDSSVSYVTPVEYFKYEVDENLLHFKDSKNIDLLVTKNHNMVYHTRKRTDNRRDENNKFISHEKKVDRLNWKVKTAEEIKLHRDVVFQSAAFSKNGGGFLSPEERLLVAIQADGHRTKFSKTAFTFRFTKERKINRLKSILEDCGLDFTVSTYDDGVTAFYVQTGKEYPKTFEWVDFTEKDSLWCADFVDEVLQWDGNQKNQYFSVIRENVDVVQTACALSGKASYLATKEREEPRQTLYSIHVKGGNSDFGVEKLEKQEVRYKGFVYCVEVPTHKLLIRRGGRTLVCGNSARRGAGAWYLPIDHNDFWEVLGHLEANPDDLNIGWNVTDSFIQKIEDGCEDSLNRYQAALKVKMTLGKGYFFFVDKANRQRPEMYKNQGLDIKASQLCSEVVLHSSEEYSYSCVLSSMNVALYDEWKDTDAVFVATVFLDCVASEFIKKASGIKWLDKVVAFTEKGRALGLGQMGLFSLFQKRRLNPEEFDAHMLNNEIARHIERESLRASQWMAEELGEPEWCKGYGVRNTHRIAIAPTKSTALIMGGWSEGINPEPAMAFSSSGAAGDIDRASPVLVELLKEKGLNVDESIKKILANNGSVQGLDDLLTEEEQSWFKTAFEIDQHTLIRLAAARQNFVDQGQSLNLFFAHSDDEEYISSVHQEAFRNENILSLYYVYSSSSIKAERTDECEACQ